MCDSGISLNSSVSSDDRDLSDKIVTEDSSECSDKESEVKMSLSRWPSLASTISSSSVSVTDVRTLTDKYQRMLMQATQEIKNLNLVKTSLEMEQEKLLKVNIEIATEAKRLVRENKAWKEERKNLIAANEEFSQEVQRLYKEEELWEQESAKLKKEADEMSKVFEEDLKKVQDKCEDEKKKTVKQIENLIESVRVLTNDNDRLLKEREREKLNNSKSHQELKNEYEANILKLEVHIASLKSELESEQILKKEVEEQINDLSISLRNMEQQFLNAKQEQQKDIKHQKEIFEKKIRTLENKSEKLAAENFEHVVANEDLKNQLQRSTEVKNKLQRDINQLNVENKWLANNTKKSSEVNGKIEDMERELHELKHELRDEKEKVKNLSDWKSQLASKNKDLKEENKRLLKKTEDLELLMNDEVSDINEMLKVVNNLQNGKQNIDVKSLKRFL